MLKPADAWPGQLMLAQAQANAGSRQWYLGVYFWLVFLLVHSISVGLLFYGRVPLGSLWFL